MADRFEQGSSHNRGRFAYQVFLSFRGEDVRKGFVDHLHHALVRNGIRTFHDDSKLERGADIQSKLYEAIQSSELSIVTFSSSYATSRWCLDELVKIMECRTLNSHVVMPIFYDVDPSVVRNQSGVYADAFDVLEVRFKEDMDRVKKWREALRTTADLAGFFLQNQADGHEAKFIQNVVREVIKKLDRGRLNIPRNVVGVESIIEDITRWIRDGSEDVEVGLIYGLGGVGKTTIAKIVYNTNCDNFEGYSFLSDIRRVSRQDNEFVRLQRQLISNISRVEVGEIHSISEGMIKICQVIGSRRILLVIDDVDELEQLYGMFDYPEWFFPGSKVIVTTRNQHLGNVCMPIKKFQVHTLNVHKSTQLFCLRAFRHDYPLQSYMKVLEKFIQYCDGLPLALEVLASSLCGKALEMWESQLAKLEDYPNRKIHNVLELSFDSIEDGNDKDIFLHIAFFLVGEYKNYAFKILEGCGLHTKIGFQNLMDRCLVTVDDCGKVMMHQLIQEMGREVVRHEDDRVPGRRSRLLNHKETCNVLRNKEGTTAIKGLRLAFPPPNSDRISKDMYTKAEQFSKNIGLSCILPTHSRRVRINLESVVTTDAFKEMRNMNLLQLENVQLKGTYEDFPKALNCLWWHGCQLETIPGDFDLYKLVVLDMRNSCLVHAWKGIKFLGVLKVLNLSNSPFLTDTPDFSSALVLEWIILIDCISLVTIHQSIGCLRNLTHLNLKGCKYLRRLPYSMCELNSLEMLDLSGCSHLLKVPDNINSSVVLSSYPASLLVPMVNECNSSLLLSRIPTAPLVSFNRFTCLKTLSLANCNISDDGVFDYFSCLSSLEDLDLSENPLCVINKNLYHFARLEYFTLENCTNLQSISLLPVQCYVFLEGCSSLKTVLFVKSLVPVYPDIFAFDCPKLVKAGDLEVQSTESMDANMTTCLGYPNLESWRYSELWQNGLSKGVYHGGTYYVFLPGDQAAQWFTDVTVGLELSYIVPCISSHEIRAFNICCVFVLDLDYPIITGLLEIKNVTRKWKWVYLIEMGLSRKRTWFYLIEMGPRNPDERKIHTLLTHWCVMEHRELKAGDELQIEFCLVDRARDIIDSDHVVVKCGIKILYEEGEETEPCENCVKEAIREEGDVEEEQKDNVGIWYDDKFRKNVDLSLFELENSPGEYIIESGIAT